MFWTGFLAGIGSLGLIIIAACLLSGLVCGRRDDEDMQHLVLLRFPPDDMDGIPLEEREDFEDRRVSWGRELRR